MTRKGEVCRHVQRTIDAYKAAGVDLTLPPWELTCLECVHETLKLKNLEPEKVTEH